MELLFLLAALIGGTILVGQFVLVVIGLADGDSFDADVDGGDGGHHGDASDPHGSTWLLGVLTFKTIVAATAFFGFGGMAALKAGQSPAVTLVIAIGAGVLALYGTHYAMLSLHRLNSDGTTRIDRAVGVQGTVYLTIPAARGGAGKVHLTVKDRMVEYQAMTPHDERLVTGATVVVTGVLGPDLVEVRPAVESPSSALAQDAVTG